MAFMPIEVQLLYFLAIAFTGYIGCRLLQFVEYTPDMGITKIIRWVKKSDNGTIIQSQDAALQTVHVCKSLCLGYRLKGSCRHLLQ